MREPSQGVPNFGLVRITNQLEGDENGQQKTETNALTDGVQTVLYTFREPPGTIQVISGDLKGAPSTTTSTFASTVTLSVTTESATRTSSSYTESSATPTAAVTTQPVTSSSAPDTTRTAATYSMGSATSSRPATAGGPTGYMLITVAGVIVVVIAATAGVPLRRKHHHPLR